MKVQNLFNTRKWIDIDVEQCPEEIKADLVSRLNLTTEDARFNKVILIIEKLYLKAQLINNEMLIESLYGEHECEETEKLKFHLTQVVQCIKKISPKRAEKLIGEFILDSRVKNLVQLEDFISEESYYLNNPSTHVAFEDFQAEAMADRSETIISSVICALQNSCESVKNSLDRGVAEKKRNGRPRELLRKYFISKFCFLFEIGSAWKVPKDKLRTYRIEFVFQSLKAIQKHTEITFPDINTARAEFGALLPNMEPMAIHLNEDMKVFFLEPELFLNTMIPLDNRIELMQ